MLASDTKNTTKLKSQITIELLRTLATVETPEEAAHKALVTTWRLMGLKNGALLLADEAMLRCVAGTGRFGEFKKLTLPAGAFPFERFGIFRATQDEAGFLPPQVRSPFRELVTMPILDSRRELLGVILVGYEASAEPDETQINQLSLVATALANTLERINSQRKVQSELAEKQALLRLSSMLEGNTDEHVRQALEEIRRMAGAEVAVVTVLDGEVYRPRLWLGDASTELAQGFAGGIPVEHARKVQALLGDEYQVLDDQDHLLAPAMRRFGVRASLVLSMNTDDQLEGLILHRTKERRGWNQAELNLLRSASQTLGAVITRVSRAKQLEARNRELEIVAAVSRALNDVASVQGAADGLAQQIAALTGASQATVNLVSPDGQSVQNVATYGLSGWVPGGVPKGEGLTWAALEGGQPVFSQDAPNDPRGYFPDSASRLRSILYVPMFDEGGRPLGTLGLSHPETGAIRDQDIKTVKIIASVAANALQRLAYKQRLEQELRAKEVLLELSHLIESDRPDSLELALEQIRGLAQADLVTLGDYDDQTIRVRMMAGEPILPIEDGGLIPQNRLRQAGIELHERLHIVDISQASGFSALKNFGVGSMYLTTAALEPGVESGLGFFRRETRPWSDLERRVMDGAARMIGALLKRTDATRRLSRQLRETQTLRDTVLAVVESQCEHIWPNLLDSAVEIVPGAEAGSIFIRNAQGFVMVAQHGYSDALLGLQFGPELLNHWFKSPGQRHNVPRVEDGEFFQAVLDFNSRHMTPDQFSLLETHGKLDQIRATLGIPIFLDGEVYACINLENLSDPRAFGPDSAETARQFALQITALVTAQRQHEVRQAAYEGALRAIGLALEARDSETAGHTDRVVQTSSDLGQAVGLSPSQLRDLRWGAYLHDIGKIMVSDAILLKPGPLTAEERAKIMLHAADGETLARQLPFLPDDARLVVRHHHERWDGKGYPDGLRGQQIPLMARIFAICDVFDALISERPYKQAFPLAQACQELSRSAKSGHLDPELVKVFLKLRGAG
ncbi:MAG: GAF domain-containing protein [Meiothermus sp.]|nr:GAF domain-containing protein [Meiothermus sp.]